MVEFIGEKEISGIRESTDTTPLGDVLIDILFIDGSTLVIPKRRYDAIVSKGASDATSLRNSVVKSTGASLYQVLFEYGIYIDEVDPILNEVARLATDGLLRADCILWGVADRSERTLQKVNSILLKDWNDKQGKDSDGATPERS